MTDASITTDQQRHPKTILPAALERLRTSKLAPEHFVRAFEKLLAAVNHLDDTGLALTISYRDEDEFVGSDELIPVITLSFTASRERTHEEDAQNGAESTRKTATSTSKSALAASRKTRRQKRVEDLLDSLSGFADPQATNLSNLPTSVNYIVGPDIADEAGPSGQVWQISCLAPRRSEFKEVDPSDTSKLSAPATAPRGILTTPGRSCHCSRRRSTASSLGAAAGDRAIYL